VRTSDLRLVAATNSHRSSTTSPHGSRCV
jgi:hypothetical protein